MRIVLDTNVLLIALPVASPFRPIFDALREGRYELAVSNGILLEYHEKLAEKTSAVVADNVVKLLLSLDNVVRQPVYFDWNLMTNDPEDNKFVDCAVGAQADHLVTDDHHFNLLKTVSFPMISMLGSNDFLRVLTNR
jgi:putative PIN family toxin of toxin-antitoxin system